VYKVNLETSLSNKLIYPKNFMKKNVVMELVKVILSKELPLKSIKVEGVNQEEKLENLVEAIKIAEKSLDTPSIL